MASAAASLKSNNSFVELDKPNHTTSGYKRNNKSKSFNMKSEWFTCHA